MPTTVESMTTFRIPAATYRLQLNAGFRFADALALVPYFEHLGITDLYTSPFLKARRGSMHGYDVTDHTAINPEIGSHEDLVALTTELDHYGMGLVLDVVPNHMGIDDGANRWWWDVLENGPSSPYAKFFDIDWAPPKEDLANKVLLPILGDQYGKVLENGEIHLLYEAGTFWIDYYERRFPVAPRTSLDIIEPACQGLRAQLDAEDPHLVELESIITSLRVLPPRTETDREQLRVRLREKEVAKRRLAALTEVSGTVRQAIEQTVTTMNGRRGDPQSFDRLEALLARQAYRLSYWRVATDEINYRRFFDVNQLAAIRVEEPEVFEAVHAIILQLLRTGYVTGLRIDHPDGLFDPMQYFLDLQSACRRALPTYACAGPERPGGAVERPCYVVIEKILVRDERLRTDWSVHGTTGYEFLNLLNGLFIDPAAERHFHALHAQLSGQPFRFGDIAYQSKKVILDGSMSSELHVLARGLDRISEQHRWSRDFTLFSLQEALAEVIACFPVYRTYIRATTNMVGDEDRHYILSALRTAKRRNPAMSESIFDFIASVLLLQDPEGLSEAERAERRDFVMRFQQITGPIMAKGIEDTAFYRVYPLASLNEVGGNPERFGLSAETFHRQNAERLANWPSALSTTSSHDTKRSEDVRARINVLSEIPRDWTRSIQRWQSLNRHKKVDVDGAEVPDANEEYLFYQTLVGTWPLQSMDDAAHQGFIARLEGYMEKALKEAKIHTSWINPNAAYDQAVKQFVREVLRAHPDNCFLDDFVHFQGRVAQAGMWNSLSQTLLKITSPGVPDVYQGSELWDLSLVDPDNRRPVDYGKRASLLEALQRRESRGLVTLVRELVAQRADGRIKLYLTYKALQFRRIHRDLFARGAYRPLTVSGAQKDHVVAFTRHLEQRWVLMAVPRFVIKLSPSAMPPLGKRIWKDTLLLLPDGAPSGWQNVLTGKDLITSDHSPAERGLLAHEVFRHLPIALLVGPGI
ncbi:MAG TPA: malto-oligosyltrehalose synthase [Candidatus Tectomicrobia bacterium]|nr:malto-oligosyltrehalose synthase [Candidatus Tectomicrobia bacterium]